MSSPVPLTLLGRYGNDFVFGGEFEQGDKFKIRTRSKDIACFKTGKMYKFMDGGRISISPDHYSAVGPVLYMKVGNITSVHYPWITSVSNAGMCKQVLQYGGWNPVEQIFVNDINDDVQIFNSIALFTR